MDHVIDAQQWLIRHVELLMSEDAEAAVPYLQRLLVATEDVQLRVYCLRNLGMLRAADGVVDEAQKYLRAAVQLCPDDPTLRHQLGELAVSNGQLWLGLVEFLEAVYLGRDGDVVTSLRAVATTMHQLEFGETALAVLIGAYERAPSDPWVLDSLANAYETEHRWLDAIAAREHLVEVLRGQASRDHLESARAQLESLSHKMRGGLRVIGSHADGALEVAREGAKTKGQHLARTTSPAGLHTLIEALGLRTEHNALLATAEALWARAREAKLDVHLSVPTLAAAIHWVVERLYWRVPTTLEQLDALYGAQPDRLPAAVRLVVACLGVRLVPTALAEPALAPEDLERLNRLQRAILFDVDVEELEPRGMLSDDD